MPDDPTRDRWHEYNVTPRYLAGPTFSGDPALQPLLDAGWVLNDDELGNVYVNAPEQTVRLGYLPEGEDDALWKITAYSEPFAMPRWLVTFQNTAPTEIVAGFTTALAAAYAEGPDSYLSCGNSELTMLDAGTPLAAAGWSHRYGPTDVSFRSPDGLAEVHMCRTRLDHTAELTGRRQDQWLMLAGPPRNQWYATASSLTPEVLVAALNAAVTDPAPVVRYGGDVRRLPPQATATPIKPPVPTPLDIHRAQAATARSTHATHAQEQRPALPAPSTTAGPPAAPTPRRR
ncbi:DUF317 domain-containing protein [Streptomyces sp. NPDC004838]